MRLLLDWKVLTFRESRLDATAHAQHHIPEFVSVSLGSKQFGASPCGRGAITSNRVGPHASTPALILRRTINMVIGDIYLR